MQPRGIIALFCLWPAAAASAQTLSPPMAEYREKASGMLELRNNGDTPLAAVLEVRGFSVDANLDLRMVATDPDLQVELGSSSFVIPPHQTHYVFYKASAKSLPAWFIIRNTLTQAKSVDQGVRVSFVLPHLVYVYQKPKLQKADVEVRVFPAPEGADYIVEFENRSAKLGRILGIHAKGFSQESEHGSFPLFPFETRRISMKTGEAGIQARVEVQFEDGFRIEEKPRSSPRALTAAAVP